MIRNMFAAVLTLVMLAGVVRGDTIRAAFVKSWGSGINVSATGTLANNNLSTAVGPYEYILSDGNGDEAAILLEEQTKNGGSTLTFCFDLYQYVSSSSLEYNIDKLEGPLYPPFGNSASIQLDSKKVMMIENLFEYAKADGALTKAKTLAGHALSVAIWEAVYEYDTLVDLSTTPLFDVGSYQGTSGFKVNYWSGDWVTSWVWDEDKWIRRYKQIEEIANDWLTDAYAATFAPGYLRGLTRIDAQDQCLLLPPENKPPEEVPEPTLAIQLLGLCMAGALPLRYWRRGRKGAA